MRARFRKKESRSFFLSICAQLAFNVKTTSFWYDLWAGGNSVIESIKGGLFYENGGERMTVKLRKGSQIPAYMAYPRFLLTMDISETAKLVYVLLLDRARLSMKNEGWEGPWEAVQSYHHDGSPAGCGSSAPGGRKKAGTAGAKAARQTPAGTSEKAAQAGLRKIMSRAGKIKKNPIGEF